MTLHLYQQHCVALGFERADFLAALQAEYGGTTVLYPGCSVHLTPSFFFPHVVYVDKSETAATLFAEQAAVLAYVARHKRYRRPPYVQFIAQDYTAPLPLTGAQFDVLLALYASSIAHACGQYLQVGGLLVTNNFQHEAETAAKLPGFKLLAVGQKQGRGYGFVPATERTVIAPPATHATGLRRGGQGLVYQETVDRYYVFQKQRK